MKTVNKVSRLLNSCATARLDCSTPAATPLSATDKPAERLSRVAKCADLLMWPWRLGCACAFTRCHYKLVKLSRLPPLLHRWDLVSVSTPLCLLKSEPCSLQAPQLPFVFPDARWPWKRTGNRRGSGTLHMTSVNTPATPLIFGIRCDDKLKPRSVTVEE